MLAPLLLAGDDDPRRDVGDPYGRVRLVHMLPPGSRRTIRIDAQIRLIDLDLDVVVNDRIDEHGRERGMTPALGIKRRDPNEPMNPVLGAEVAVCILTAYLEAGRLQPSLISRLRLQDFHLPASTLGVPRIHANEHLGPVL